MIRRMVLDSVKCLEENKIVTGWGRVGWREWLGKFFLKREYLG